MRRLATLSAMGLAFPATLAAAPPPAAPEPAIVAPAQPLQGGTDFITPAGEPVHSPDRLSGAEHWFIATDADHDGRLTAKEMRANADMFFVALDRDHDGEIDPSEIERYETVIAPEIRVGSTFGGYTGNDKDGKPQEAPYPDRLGAGRFGYIDVPEPIIAMDANLDRGVTRAEFARAVDRRFGLLDSDRDGFITRAELPKLSALQAKRIRRRSGGNVPHPEGGQ